MTAWGTGVEQRTSWVKSEGRGSGDYLSAQVCLQVCACAGSLTSSDVDKIQVQAQFGNFFMRIVSHSLGNCSQLTYPVAVKSPGSCQGLKKNEEDDPGLSEAVLEHWIQDGQFQPAKG